MGYPGGLITIRCTRLIRNMVFHCIFLGIKGHHFRVLKVLTFFVEMRFYISNVFIPIRI